MSQFFYLFYKLYRWCWTQIKLTRHRLKPGVYRIGLPAIDARSRIVFEFNDPKRFHLGDQLFYASAIQYLTDNQVEVWVNAPAEMRPFFKKLRANVQSDDDFYGAGIRVLPFQIVNQNQINTGNSIVFDLTDSKIQVPVSQYIAQTIKEILGLQSNPNPLRYTPDPVPINLPEKSILFSNSVDSGGFRLTQEMHKKLCNRATQLRDEGYHIVHVGTKEDQRRHPDLLPFVDIDLRGKTSPIDLIDLCYTKSVERAVAFDNFVMHAMLMAGKSADVVFRGRYSKSASDFHFRAVNEAMKSGAAEINYL